MKKMQKILFLNKIFFVGGISIATVSWNRKVKFIDCDCGHHHSHKKRKDSLETRALLLIFLLEPELSGVVVQSTHQKHQNSEKWWLLWGIFYSENNIEAVLANLCCYDHGSKASETVQKIAIDQKEYHKCSSCVIIWWIAKIYLAINHSSNSEKWLVTRIYPTKLKRLLNLYRKNSNNWPMECENVSEITR